MKMMYGKFSSGGKSMDEIAFNLDWFQWLADDVYFVVQIYLTVKATLTVRVTATVAIEMPSCIFNDEFIISNFLF